MWIKLVVFILKEKLSETGYEIDKNRLYVIFGNHSLCCFESGYFWLPKTGYL